MIRVTRRYTLSASHRLHSPQLSEDENRHLYGKCNNPFGHGHNYTIEVSARGPVDPESGIAVDLAALDRLVREQVLAVFDHKDLNGDSAFSGTVPTTENFGLEIRNRLSRGWRGVFPGEWPALEKVRIAETRRNIFEVHEGH